VPVASTASVNQVLSSVMRVSPLKGKIRGREYIG